jgi:hypothetical protein
MGRRPFAAEVTQGAAGKFVTPDVRIQKCPRKGTAHAASVVSEVEVPQRLGGYLGDVRPIPTAADCDCLLAAHGLTDVRLQAGHTGCKGSGRQAFDAGLF